MGSSSKAYGSKYVEGYEIVPEEGHTVTAEGRERIYEALTDYQSARDHNSRMLAQYTHDPRITQSADAWSAANKRLQAVCAEEGSKGVAVVLYQRQQSVEQKETESRSCFSSFFKSVSECFSSCTSFCESEDDRKKQARKASGW